MDIAVFGATGFVGRNLLDELAGTDHRVLACDVEPPAGSLPDAEFHQVDITDSECVDSIVSRVDTVAHLAAHPLGPSTEQPKLNAEVNVMGTLNLLEAARHHDVDKFFFSSASSIVGEVESVPVTEDHPVAPRSPYAVSKHAVEEYLDVYRELYGLDYLVFRFFNVYGPYQFPESGALVPVVLSRLARGEGVFVTGDGRQTRDFVFSRDVAEFIVHGLERDVRNEIVNMGRGADTAIIDAVELMAAEVGIDPEVERRPKRPDEIDDFYADTSKCQRLFGQKPDTDLQVGIEHTYAWMQDQFEF